MRNKPLTAAFVNNIRKPGRYGDGHGGRGLTLDVKIARNGRVAKSWIQRVRINGKPTHIGLGAPEILNLRVSSSRVRLTPDGLLLPMISYYRDLIRGSLNI